MTPSSFPSLPDFSAAPPPAGGDPELAALLASVAAPTGSEPGGAGPGLASPGFDRWLAQPIPAAIVPPASARGPVPPDASGLGLPFNGARLTPPLSGQPVGEGDARREGGAILLTLPLSGEPVGPEPAGRAAGIAGAPVVPDGAGFSPDFVPGAAPALPTREELEAAAALLAPLGQALVALFAAVETPAAKAGAALSTEPAKAASVIPPAAGEARAAALAPTPGRPRPGVAPTGGDAPVGATSGSAAWSLEVGAWSLGLRDPLAGATSGPTVSSASPDLPELRLTLQPGQEVGGGYAIALPLLQVGGSLFADPKVGELANLPVPDRAEPANGPATGLHTEATVPSETPADLATLVRRGFETLAAAQRAGSFGSSVGGAPGDDPLSMVNPGSFLPIQLRAGGAPGVDPLRGPVALDGATAGSDPEPAATVAAEVALADGTTLRIEFGRPLVASGGGPTLRPLAFEARRPLAAANTAALAVPAREVAPSLGSAVEKNFLNDKGETFADGRQPVGIAVAETVGNMVFRSRSLPNDVPGAAAAFVLGSGRGAEGAFAPAFATDHGPTPALPLPPSTASLASRAVGTVLNVVETQAASRLQPVPSVQLHFKFGAEDLSVRVEMRGGEVRTEFRTDSAALRATLSEEWRAVAAAPAAGLRLLEPAFGPSTARGSSFDPSATGQQTASQHHSHSHQQHADARAHQEANGVFGRVARSFLAAPSAPASAPVAPASSHRANSRHLSVVA